MERALIDTPGRTRPIGPVAVQATSASGARRTGTIFDALGVALLIGGLGLASVAPAKGELVRPIRFGKGAKSSLLADAVVRGESHTYEFRARRGQQGRIVISAAERNAVFQLLSPADSVPNSPRLMIAGPEARYWSGSLPWTGTYRIIVSGTRGNASYRLRLAIN